MDILLVDDETAFAGLLADRLRLRGYTVRCAPTGEKALALIEEKAPDVAFLDVGLPGMDGLALLEKIRLMPDPVICCMLTGAAQVSVAAKALRYGAFDWLAKPVTLNAIETVLVRVREYQKKTRQQEVLAEAARMRSLERLTQGIAHEVNNPVNIMLQAAGEIEDILLDDALQVVPEELRRDMDGAIATIKRQSRRVRELTGTLLVLGRGLDRGSRAVSLAEAAEEVFGMFRTRFESCGVTAETRMDSAMPAFLGSRLEMRQVLLHLVENALDAMPHGGKLVVSGFVRAAEGSGEEAVFGDGTDGTTGKLVEIRVCDTGEVIPGNIREDIFQPFFTTREVGKGKGLGLSVCRSLVESRGGRISLEKSVPGETCFRILLPFVQAPEIAASGR